MYTTLDNERLEKYRIKISGDFKGYRRGDEDRGHDKLTVQRIDNGMVKERQTVNARHPAELCLSVIDMIKGQKHVYGMEYIGDADRTSDFSMSNFGRILHYIIDEHNKKVHTLMSLEEII